MAVGNTITTQFILDPKILRMENKMTRQKAHQFLNFKFCSYLPVPFLTGTQHYNVKSRSRGNSDIFPAEGYGLYPRIMLKTMNGILSSPQVPNIKKS
jgi:hypothetical protein